MLISKSLKYIGHVHIMEPTKAAPEDGLLKSGWTMTKI